MSSYAARRTRNSVAMLLAIVAAVIGLVFLFLILATLLVKGFTAISPQMFLENTPPPGEDGGLLNAIVGSLAMTVIAIVVATPVGILAGTFLSEYSRGHWLGEAAKFVNDILLSAPSIIIGLFVYTVVVVPVGHFSAWAGAASLGLIALPVINRTTQDMLGLVPNALREAAAALGAPRWKSMVSVIYRAAMSGILTGVLLAIARVTGETAPLLFTAFGNNYMAINPMEKMSSLPQIIYQYANDPGESMHALAWAGAFVITMFVLLLSLASRLILSRTKVSHD